MQLAILALALAPAWGQMKIPATPSAAQSAAVRAAAAGARLTEKRMIPRQAFAALENEFDSKIESTGRSPNSIELLGRTRGLYLEGFGAVFTTELSLAYSPAITPFHTQITDREKQNLHTWKVERLPFLRQAMHDMMIASGKALESVPAEQQIVFSVRLLYMPWEDTTGLPAEITMRGDRKSVMAGNFQTDEQ